MILFEDIKKGNTDLDKEIKEKKALEQEKEVLDYAFLSFDNPDYRQDALHKILKYIYNSPKIYDGNSFVKYFLNLIDASRHNGWFLCDKDYIYNLAGNFDYSYIFNRNIWDNYESDIELFINSDILPITGNYFFWPMIPVHLIKGYFPMLLKKANNVDLKSFFERVVKDLEEFSDLEMRFEMVEKYDTGGHRNHRFPINYSSTGNIEYLVECMKQYPNYFSDDEKEKIGNLICQVLSRDIRIIKNEYKEGEMLLKKFRNYYFVTSKYRISKEKNKLILAKHKIYDYMDFIDKDLSKKLYKMSNDLSAAKNHSAACDCYHEGLVFEALEKANRYALFVFKYCGLIDLKNITKYVDFIIDIDAPMVGYYFIEVLYKYLSENDINKLLYMLKEESLSLYSKSVEIIKQKSDNNKEVKSNPENSEQINEKEENISDEYLWQKLSGMTIEQVFNECTEEEKMFLSDLLKEKSNKLTLRQ